MGLRRKLKSRTSVAHADATSPDHARHLEEQKERGFYVWEPALADVNPVEAKEAFALDLTALNLPSGMTWLFRDDQLVEASGIQFQRSLNKLREEKNWYWQHRKLRSGEWSKTKRNRKDPVEEFVVNFSPAQQRFFRSLTNPEEIKLMVLQMARPLVDAFKESTGREILGMAIHWDSSKVHFNIYHTRVSQNHRLVGVQRLGTLGPWSVGQARLQRLGIGGEVGDKRLAENLQRFQKRKGENAEPLDLKMHRLLDQNFEKALSPKQRALYRECEEFHKKWKEDQRKRLAQRKRSPDELALMLLNLLFPFLPQPLQLALKTVRFVQQAVDIVGAFVSTATATKNQPQIPTPQIH